jgi:hypothetical protein
MGWAYGYGGDGGHHEDPDLGFHDTDPEPEKTPDAGDWYVSIQNHGIKEHPRYYSFVAAGSNSLRDFKSLAEKHEGFKVEAEVFGVTDYAVDRIMEPLAELVKRLNNGEKLDTQKELEDLCK